MTKETISPFRHPYLLTALVCLAVTPLCLYEESPVPPALGIVLALVLLLVSVGLWLGKIRTERYHALLLCAAGFCMRLAYVLATPYYIRQHDVGRFDDESGHAAYITYLYNHLHLPDFDVRTVWQFYHPPVHHSIAAAWMKLLTALGASFAQAGEAVQVLPLFYSCLCMVLLWKLLQSFRLKGSAALLPLGILAFHPTFFILAGSINNDMLSITFFLASMVLMIQWYRDPKLLTILKLACTIGLGMMTKLSVWMAAPATAMLFLVVLYRNRKQPLPYIGQFAAFGCVCVPLGLGWGVRNLIRWGVPLAYVPMLSPESKQYIGDIPVWRRLFDFSGEQLTYVYDCFTIYGQSYDEFNPLVGLWKTAMFDELIQPESFPEIVGLGELLFYSNILLSLAAVAALVWVWVKRPPVLEGFERLAITMTYAITLISYYSFCLVYAHVCTQNIRYATPLIFIGCLALGLWMQQPSKYQKALKLGLFLGSALFVLGSTAVYWQVCLMTSSASP